jgi:uroporphyrinogen decarboxylase
LKQLQNDRLIRALLRQPVDTTPIWIMRQAGRYLPEYRALRHRVNDFMTLCKTPELACEVTLQPLARFPLDGAIIFSDILTIPDAMGLGLYFKTHEGPHFQRSIRTDKDVDNLSMPDMETDLRYVMDTIRLVSYELAAKVPLIGFSGSPWTLATYMVEGGSSKNFQLIKGFLFAQPDVLQRLLTLLAEVISLYLQAQIAAGVDAVMIFDTWGGILTTRDYYQFSLQPMQKIVTDLKQQHPTIPVILFTKNAGLWLSEIVKTGCDAIGVDWTIDLKEARTKVADQVTLQGNMDPGILYASPQRIEDEVQQILASYGYGHGHVFNLGHGIYPDIAPENVEVLVDAVHRLGKTYHSNF